MTVFSYEWLPQGERYNETCAVLAFSMHPQGWMLPCACTSPAHRQALSETAAVSWGTAPGSKVNGCRFGAAAVYIHGENRKKKKSKTQILIELKEHLLSRRLGTLSAFVNGVFLLNVFPSNTCFFVCFQKSCLHLQCTGSHCLYCLGSNEGFFWMLFWFDLMTLFASELWKLWLFGAQEGHNAFLGHMLA